MYEKKLSYISSGEKLSKATHFYNIWTSQLEGLGKVLLEFNKLGRVVNLTFCTELAKE